jgi:glycosyltransferase involved in cell wall biosynthesis
VAEPQHIAFVCPRFAEDGTVGGAETLLRNLAGRLAGLGRRVTFLTTCARNHFSWENEIPPGTRRWGDVEVIHFPVDGGRDAAEFLRAQDIICRRGNPSAADEETWIRNSVHSRPLYEHLQERGKDYDRVIMGPYLFGLIYHASRIHPGKTLLVPCLHDEPFAHLPATRAMFDAVRGILFNSEPEAALAQRLMNLSPDRWMVVGAGLEAFEADPRAFAARRGLASPYVIYSGRREAGKGTPLLTGYLHAFRQRTGTDIRLVVTGSGPIEAPSEFQPYVMDVGYLPEKEKQEAMAGALAFVHPSVMESLGIVLLESFLARTPALVHARSEVLRWQCARSGGGLWFRSYPEFEEELRLLLRDPALRREMGARGRQYVLREYSWDRVEKRLLDALSAFGR